MDKLSEQSKNIQKVKNNNQAERDKIDHTASLNDPTFPASMLRIYNENEKQDIKKSKNQLRADTSKYLAKLEMGGSSSGETHKFQRKR